MFRWFKSSSASHPLVAKFKANALPDSQTPIKDCPLLAIDLETTGLNARRDHIVSIGWVPVRAREIIIRDARHYLVKSPVSVGQSALVHGILDRDLKDARELGDVLTELLDTYAGYIFVAHHAALDKRFLQKALRQNFGSTPKFHFIDTMEVERHELQRRGMAAKPNTLTLAACLQRHHLPSNLLAHDALEDAYACALLLLAQTRRPQTTVGGLRQSLPSV